MLAKIIVAILKYINSEQQSTIVVMSGVAIKAGSRRALLASIGSIAPIIFDIMTVAIIDMTIVTASKILCPYIKYTITPFTNASIELTIIDIRNSLNTTLKKSEKCIDL